LYDRLFNVPNPDDDSDGKSYRDHLNPGSKRIVRGYLEASLANVPTETRFQFERLGYFVSDRFDHSSEKPVFNRIVTLRDSYAKAAK
jgi:glutaminyl-tRNA synthetase